MKIENNIFKKYDYKIEIFDKDKLVGETYIYKNKAKVYAYTTDGIQLLIPIQCETKKDVEDALSYRIIDENSPDIQEALDYLHLKEYDVLEIARLTYCLSYDDNIWVRINNDTLTYQDILNIIKD